MYVSSTYQLRPIRPLRRRRRLSIRDGVSFSSQSRTACVTELDPPDQKHFEQVAQAEFVAEPPEQHHERDTMSEGYWVRFRGDRHFAH